MKNLLAVQTPEGKKAPPSSPQQQDRDTNYDKGRQEGRLETAAAALEAVAEKWGGLP